VGDISATLPDNEAQARPLSQLEPDQQREVWQEAVKTAPNGKITGAHVAGVVREFIDNPATWQKSGIYEPKHQVHFSSETPEWYTPQHIIDRALMVLGEIDLDPCSNSHDVPNVPARHHLTQQDDGLSHQWLGHVYMNPPYGREIAEWIDHLCQEWEAGRVTEAIALVPARTDTEWFRQLRQFPRCFIWGRLHFSEQDNGAPFPSMIVYLGDNLDKFIEAFENIGDIYQRIGNEH